MKLNPLPPEAWAVFAGAAGLLVVGKTGAGAAANTSNRAALLLLLVGKAGATKG